MGAVAAPVGRDAVAPQHRLDPRAQGGQRRVRRDGGVDQTRPPARLETADAVDREIERRRPGADRIEIRRQVADRAGIAFAQVAQGDVQGLRGHPAGAGHPARPRGKA